MGEFKLPPVSSLAGSTIYNFYKILQHHKIASDKYSKIFFTQLIILGCSPFHLWEKIRFHSLSYKFQFKEPPIFILGHWRSGTTHLHNLLCQDDGVSYLTTYHSVFPNNLASKSIFKNLMRKQMPDTRPGDNVKLNVDYPQEDEFALSNTMPFTFYNFFYFPAHYAEYYDNYVRFISKDPSLEQKWKREYKNLLIKAAINTGNKRLVVKNPVNTARIRILLEMFPQAKFVHIHRNPVEVYLSTKKFFLELLPKMWLQKVSDTFISDMILDIYQRIYVDFFDQVKLIPEQNLYELSFQELQDRPLLHLENIYKKFELDDFSRHKNQFISYLEQTKNYKKNSYRIDEEEKGMVIEKWHGVTNKLGYRLSFN